MRIIILKIKLKPLCRSLVCSTRPKLLRRLTTLFLWKTSELGYCTRTCCTVMAVLERIDPSFLLLESRIGRFCPSSRNMLVNDRLDKHRGIIFNSRVDPTNSRRGLPRRSGMVLLFRVPGSLAKNGSLDLGPPIPKSYKSRCKYCRKPLRVPPRPQVTSSRRAVRTNSLRIGFGQ